MCNVVWGLWWRLYVTACLTDFILQLIFVVHLFWMIIGSSLRACACCSVVPLPVSKYIGLSRNMHAHMHAQRCVCSFSPLTSLFCFFSSRLRKLYMSVCFMFSCGIRSSEWRPPCLFAGFHYLGNVVPWKCRMKGWEWWRSGSRQT